MDFNMDQYAMFPNEWKDWNEMWSELLYTSDDSGRVEKVKHKIPHLCLKREKFKTELHILKWFPFIVSSWNPEQMELWAHSRISATWNLKF
jgi:hypothetical protein